MDLNDINTYKDFDNFFYYGLNDIDVETKSDLFQILMQPKRSLFYNRSNDAAGLSDYENHPNSMFLTINLPYDIVLAIAKRNQYVSNGDEGYPDRRVAISQSTVLVRLEKGVVKCTVYYIPMHSLRQSEAITQILNVNI